MDKGIIAIYHPFDTILTFVFSIQIHCLPSKRARTAPSLVQQTSIIIQESPVIPQDALLESGVRALLLASSSAPTTDEVPLIQAQDSPDNSMFSFQLGTISAEDEATPSVESAPLSEETKAKLQEILQLLNQRYWPTGSRCRADSYYLEVSERYSSRIS
ncbi:uncharacterized protein LOC120665960 [Panicum virgatum]|uniref:uncharacterized protein LOC120665960 n=1 Tax=Panicum virgatum TaxID=38727 RepID=UPI0019D532E2|nr:uncharacterized protein LOC120665960 [Panicum virgatum]